MGHAGAVHVRQRPRRAPGPLAASLAFALIGLLLLRAGRPFAAALCLLGFGSAAAVVFRRSYRPPLLARLDSRGVHDAEGTIPWLDVEDLRLHVVRRQERLSFAVSRERYPGRGHPHDPEWPERAPVTIDLRGAGSRLDAVRLFAIRARGRVAGRESAAEDLAVGVAAGVDPDLGPIVAGILCDREIPDILALLGGVPRVTVEARLAEGMSLAQAHASWNSEALPDLQGVARFGRQPPEAVTPPGLVRVVCECVRAPSGGMSSYHGFRGWFLSLLVSIPARIIWDARMEEAT
jgi:hypothetical protein